MAGDQKPARTDIGTIVLHWAIVLFLLPLMATGLQLAADNEARGWMAPLRDLLPQGEIWSLHLAAGLGLGSTVAGYLAYIAGAGLTRRIAIDRTRLMSVLCGRGIGKLANVLLIWLMLIALLTQCVSGFLLLQGYGGRAVELHYVAALTLIALPLLHIGLQYAAGGVSQLLRIVRPSFARSTGELPSFTAMLVARVERLEAARQARAARRQESWQDSRRHPQAELRQRDVTLRAHPLAVAVAVAASVAIVAMSADYGLQPRLSFARIELGDAPRIDGDLSDPVWQRGASVSVETNEGANFAGTRSSTVEIKALTDGRFAYVAVTWEDPTRSLKHLPLIKRVDGWHLMHSRYDVEDEDQYFEDKLSIALARAGSLPAAIHLGPRPLADRPGSFSGRGLHYTANGVLVDVWHWKAVQGGLLGYVDDNYFGPPAEPRPEEVTGKRRYRAGYAVDPGEAFYSNNFAVEGAGGYQGPLQPLRLPRSGAGEGGLESVSLAADDSVPSDSQWWLTEENSVPFSAKADAAFPIDSIVPGVLIAGSYSGDRADIRGAASWAAGHWTLEIVRRLDTGSPYDIAIEDGIVMWVAAFDHAQTRHTHHLRPIIVEIEK